jgi:hypothetical protein
MSDLATDGGASAKAELEPGLHRVMGPDAVMGLPLAK